MKIALIHDWLRVNAGSEKVVKEILNIYKDDEVELYTLFNTLLIQDKKDIIRNIPCTTSCLNYIPYIHSLYKSLLPIMPWVIQHMKLKSADVYISSSHAVAKGIQAPKDKLHICYCHTPMRYAWYMYEDYMSDIKGLKLLLIKLIIPYIKTWDFNSSKNVHYFIANSKHIQNQIEAIYHRDSIVIYPPVQVDKFKLNSNPRKDFYLAVGRFVAYKKMDIIIQAFKLMPHKKLVLIGDGYDTNKIKNIIEGADNIIWLGYQHDDELILYMQNAKACIFAAKEDFGIMCVEAQSTGTPVLALNYGGYKETVIDGETGYFFETQQVEAIQQVVERFELSPLTNHTAISTHASKFSVERFKNEMKSFVTMKYSEFYNNSAC
jgi:glycosyltransferase involved in cell wall biosynthesis